MYVYYICIYRCMYIIYYYMLYNCKHINRMWTQFWDVFGNRTSPFSLAILAALLAPCDAAAPPWSASWSLLRTSSHDESQLLGGPTPQVIMASQASANESRLRPCGILPHECQLQVDKPWRFIGILTPPCENWGLFHRWTWPQEHEPTLFNSSQAATRIGSISTSPSLEISTYLNYILRCFSSEHRLSTSNYQANWREIAMSIYPGPHFPHEFPHVSPFIQHFYTICSPLFPTFLAILGSHLNFQVALPSRGLSAAPYKIQKKHGDLGDVHAFSHHFPLNLSNQNQKFQCFT